MYVELIARRVGLGLVVVRDFYGEVALRLTLRVRTIYATLLCEDDGATLDDCREAVTTLEDVARTARRVLGGSHPITTGIERELQGVRAALRARETPPTSA